VPTLAQTVPGYSSRGWYGLLGPANLPRPIVDKLNDAVHKALATEDVKQKLLTSGSEPLGNTPEQFAEFIRTEIPKWAKVIKDAGITPQ
jgi:tripartite-type tricarboxylate transporter receptor subunit TctC